MYKEKSQDQINLVLNSSDWNMKKHLRCFRAEIVRKVHARTKKESDTEQRVKILYFFFLRIIDLTRFNRARISQRQYFVVSKRMRQCLTFEKNLD